MGTVDGADREFPNREVCRGPHIPTSAAVSLGGA